MSILRKQARFVKLLAALILLPCLNKGFAQSDISQFRHKNYFSISANYQPGKIIPTTDFIRGDNLAGKPLEK